jgi:hypothetical protein
MRMPLADAHYRGAVAMALLAGTGRADAFASVLWLADAACERRSSRACS